MQLDRTSGAIEHHHFRDLERLLRSGDLLVLNDTRVLAARLFGHKPSGGRVEVLLLEREGGTDDDQEWRCLIHASRRPAEGSQLTMPQGLTVRILERRDDWWRVRIEAGGQDVARRLESAGQMPLPPYIHREPRDPHAATDRERYQTVFARRPGAVAAPTAGLHFTRELLQRLEAVGVELAWITLHVGLGTFQPVRVQRVEGHRMHEEAYEVRPDLVHAVRRARERKARVVAVGTTVVRALEHRARGDGQLRPGTGRCDLFIYPGFHFRVVDALITNFHLPRSTLLMLASAFAGREKILGAYREALERGYRFYSYGDAMLIEE